MRNKLNWVGGLLLWMLFGFMMLMFSLNPVNGWSGLIAVASFFAAICYLISLTTMFSFVKLTRESLQIVNPGMRVIVPWGRVEGVDAENGLVVRVADHRDVACYAFQGSLLGKLWGVGGMLVRPRLSRHGERKTPTRYRVAKFSQRFLGCAICFGLPLVGPPLL